MINELKQLICRARNEISIFKPNGRYFLNCKVELYDPIKSDELLLLGEKYNINLPSDYCEYLTLIGNGGNQPQCGMFSVQQSLAIHFKESPSCRVLSESDLCDKYFGVFYYQSRNKDREFKFGDDKLTLDDYFDYESKIFIYQHYLVDGDLNTFDEYESRMKSHLLIFSYFDMFHVEYAIALDGIHKGEVIYYSYESICNIKLTHMTFVEWMTNYYKHALDCKPGNFTAID